LCDAPSVHYGNPSLQSFLERRFQLRTRGSTLGREVTAGITSFLTAAYLLVVIPTLLANGGMDRSAVTTATILMFAAGTALMGLYANLPFLVGPGIGGSVLVGVTLTAAGVSWQTGLAIACLSGILFFVLTVLGAREVVTRIIPKQIKLGLSASIGIFIALLGFRNAGLVTVDVRSHAFALGDFTRPDAVVALVGLALAVLLQTRRVPGAVLWAIVGAALFGVLLSVTHLPATPVALPHGLGPVFGQVTLSRALTLTAVPYLFVFFASEFFSTLGTTLAVGDLAGLLDADGNLPNINRPFVVDSIAATVGPFFGVPGMTAVIESSAGAQAGGRTGLTALAATGCFALMLFLIPVALAIPQAATAPALILIGLSMFGGIRHVGAEFTDLLPVLLMVLLTLMSNSFGTGIAGGLLAHVVVKLLAGRHRELHWGLYVLAVPLGAYFWTVVRPH
jgi:AGZA family xanthine/uracil permease-like MFS transporter